MLTKKQILFKILEDLGVNHCTRNTGCQGNCSWMDRSLQSFLPPLKIGLRAWVRGSNPFTVQPGRVDVRWLVRACAWNHLPRLDPRVHRPRPRSAILSLSDNQENDDLFNGSWSTFALINSCSNSWRFLGVFLPDLDQLAPRQSHSACILYPFSGRLLPRVFARILACGTTFWTDRLDWSTKSHCARLPINCKFRTSWGFR